MVFWDVILYSLIDRHHCFKKICCLHHQGRRR